MDYKRLITDIEEEVAAHDSEASQTISLVASGNVVSPRVLRIMESDLLHRAAEGKSQKAHFPGLNHYYHIENNAEKEIARLFHADFADLRPISGSQANMVVFTSLTNIGDTIMSLSIKGGAHVSMSGKMVRNIRSYIYIHPEQIKGSLILDIDKTLSLIRTHKPRLLLLGGSLVNEWQDPQLLCDAVHEYGGVVLYDASHTAGLIATGVYPNPLDHGADIMTMTTCKTIPGPSHAWILGRESFKIPIEKTVFPGFVSGGHLQEYIGAVVSLYEILQTGDAYGHLVLATARLLGQSLENAGFTLLRTQKGHVTDTHQVVLISHPKFQMTDVEKRLAAAGILTNVNYLPVGIFDTPLGLRLGTQEIVRQGATLEHIPALAALMMKIIRSSDDEVQLLRSEVASLRASFGDMKFW